MVLGLWAIRVLKNGNRKMARIRISLQFNQTHGLHNLSSIRTILERQYKFQKIILNFF